MNVEHNPNRVKRRLATLIETPFEEHQRGLTIGGSEVSSIMGMNPYKSAYRLYLEKAGIFPPEDLSARDAVHFGTEFEPIIIKRWCENKGIDYNDLVTRRSTYTHPLLKWMSFSPDGYHKDCSFGVECKLVGTRTGMGWGVEGTDEIPSMYLMQLVWGAMVTRIPLWYIIALVGTELRTYKYVHRPELAKQLLKKARRFMKVNVRRRIPPPATNTNADAEALKLLHPRSGGNIRNATPSERALVERYSELYPKHKELEKEVQDLRAQLKQMIGNDKGISDGQNIATWKSGPSGKRSWGFGKTNYE